MDDNVKKIIADSISTLPADLKSVLVSDNLRNDVFLACEQNGVSDIENKSAVFLETILVLTGLEDSRDYLRNLKSGTKVPDENVRKLGESIASKIFKPVSESLRIISQANESEISPESLSGAEQPETPSAKETEKENERSAAIQAMKNIPQKTDKITEESGIGKYNESVIMPPTRVLVQSQPNPVTTFPPSNLPGTESGKPETPFLKNIADEKLNSVVKLPKEEKFVDILKSQNNYKGEDPYREPLE